MDIIKLRSLYNGDIYVNVKNIDGFYRSEENDTCTTKIYTSGSGIPFLVYDSVEEILNKIKEVAGLTINSDEERDKPND